ncbi:MAG: hypothetical protein NC399_02425 [Muribaculum sp.]|nr:hypothetical protein [Muribaculum sp.]
MLKTFNNETEFGKLYVSYPMIEAIKEIDIKIKDYIRLYLSLDEIFDYKQNPFLQSDFGNYYRLEKEHWVIACNASRKRASILAQYKEQCNYNYFIHNLDQESLYFFQKKNYINNGHLLCILNSVPLFLLEYFGEDFWNQVMDNI